MMRGFEKHFKVKSSEIKTWRFGDDMSPLSNANYLSNRPQVSMVYKADKPRGMLVEHEKNL